ncbi:hypothetical protein FS837_005887 [Tulasnella sp. UAMH 9824]|nr:hypothetical protein FS837_005887 [Tulasnella sp. UAMH 9824]
MATSAQPATPPLSFQVGGRLSGQNPFAARTGTLSIPRQESSQVEVSTPNFLTLTSRGNVPHLSRDHVKKTDAIGWVHVPFESFLERTPPVPTLYPSDRPLHGFLGFDPSRHIVSVSLRNWNDARDITPNGKDTVSALCVRGVRAVTPSAYNSYITSIRPDIVVALSDIPFGSTPPSEKRLDLFDSHFAQQAADWGVALDFRFRAPSSQPDAAPVDIGVNLYDVEHEMEFNRFAKSLRGGAEEDDASLPICPCIACTPKFSPTPILHSSIDETPTDEEGPAPPFTRGYVHHLLHTHEMTAHVLLAAHNLSVLSKFFADIRVFLAEVSSAPDAEERFNEEIRQFEQQYKRPDELMRKAKVNWEEVNLARGKGRLAREKAAKATENPVEITQHPERVLPDVVP